jgi:hypothetical protein
LIEDKRINSNSPRKYTEQVNFKVPKPYEDPSLKIQDRVELKRNDISEQFNNPYQMALPTQSQMEMQDTTSNMMS